MRVWATKRLSIGWLLVLQVYQMVRDISRRLYFTSWNKVLLQGAPPAHTRRLVVPRSPRRGKYRLRTFVHSTLACGSMVLSLYCVSFFRPAGRKNDAQHKS